MIAFQHSPVMTMQGGPALPMQGAPYLPTQATPYLTTQTDMTNIISQIMPLMMLVLVFAMIVPMMKSMTGAFGK